MERSFRHPRSFDLVAGLGVEGGSKSAISRAVDISWNTVARWLEWAGAAARRFNDERLRDFELVELQRDEIRTFATSKKHVTWAFTSIEVWSWAGAPGGTLFSCSGSVPASSGRR